MSEERREFTARYLADISKMMFALALASKLFLDLRPELRIGLPTLGAALFVIAYFLCPIKRRNTGGS